MVILICRSNRMCDDFGSVSHDFWKTGIVYRSSSRKGVFDSLKIYDGVATEDDPSLVFYLPGVETMLSLFNFDYKKTFGNTLRRADLGPGSGEYIIKDFLTGQPAGKIEKGQAHSH